MMFHVCIILLAVNYAFAVDCDTATDVWYCGKYGIVPSVCNLVFSGTQEKVSDRCPFMCGVCSETDQCPGVDPNMCQNGGTFEVASCSCTCKQFYAGDQCQEMACPSSENPQCGTGYTPDMCDIYSNVPQECPFMCGICSVEDACPGMDAEGCQNGGIFDIATCSCDCPSFYSGNYCQTKDECPDTVDAACASWTPELCNHYVQGEDYQISFLCPYLCGICTVEEKCPGASDECSNDGVFNLATCSCDCPTFFSGPNCEDQSCPANDDSRCSAFSAEVCDYVVSGEEFKIKDICPYLCGSCDIADRCPDVPTTCLNGGTFDLASCTCDCPSLFEGDQCQTESECPVEDDSKCSAWILSQCEFYITDEDYQIKDICPYMCGLCDIADRCPGADPTGCLNGGQFSPATCSCDCSYYYEGEQCQTKSECPNGDEFSCKNWNPTMCDFWVTDEEYQISYICPFMCGICSVDEKCPGANSECQNGGTFNLEKCSCDCPLPYSGVQCQTKDECSADADYCGTPQPYGFEVEHCVYSNVPPVCPHMCGVC